MLNGPWKGAATPLPTAKYEMKKWREGEQVGEGKEGIFIKAQTGLFSVTICFVLLSKGL